jgi:hypothetical protein
MPESDRFVQKKPLEGRMMIIFTTFFLTSAHNET